MRAEQHELVSCALCICDYATLRLRNEIHIDDRIVGPVDKSTNQERNARHFYRQLVRQVGMDMKYLWAEVRNECMHEEQTSRSSIIFLELSDLVSTKALIILVRGRGIVRKQSYENLRLSRTVGR